MAQRHFECYSKEEDYTLSKENSTVKRPETCIIDIIRNWEKISVETIRRVLHNAGIHGRTPVRKPLINSVYRKKRLSFAKEHISKPESF
ncbi:hypothetical protein TNCV_3418381 [Trichonephila clavipes]|nr:hypothetical protein TNCV_3418381 [Trichonephila clavipes]